VKILIADDHALIREGLEQTLTALGEDVRFVHCGNKYGVLEQLRIHKDMDVVLLDLLMPGVSGFDLLSEICDRHVQLPVIVISANEDPNCIRKSIDYGASGFIPKSASTEVIISAIQLVLNGGVYIPAELLSKKNHITGSNFETPQMLDMNDTGVNTERLTTRQKDVLELMARGMSNKKIARSLNVSEYTVKVHVSAILHIFNASNRTEVVVRAKHLGIIEG
jgi:DNA-binding NarL/FixJ family response regulator